jgi:hypothetical protein
MLLASAPVPTQSAAQADPAPAPAKVTDKIKRDAVESADPSVCDYCRP